MIRIERVLIGGGPGANRLAMTLQAQTYLGERWELTFVKEGLDGACACLKRRCGTSTITSSSHPTLCGYFESVEATLGFPRHAGRHRTIHFFRQDDGLTGRSPAMTRPLRTEC